MANPNNWRAWVFVTPPLISCVTIHCGGQARKDSLAMGGALVAHTLLLPCYTLAALRGKHDACWTRERTRGHTYGVTAGPAILQLEFGPI